MIRTLFVYLLFLSAAFALVTLAGCAGTLIAPGEQRSAPGEAAYSLERTAPDGSTCRATATSGREVKSAEIAITEGCGLTVSVESLDGSEAQARSLDLVGQALGKIPGVQ
jgi:hypothetical protein